MNERINLNYAKNVPRAGHSCFGVASVCMAGSDCLFIALAAPPLCISPFDSMGNEKETRVAILAAILGILLGIRAMQDASRKQTLAILGLVLNALALLAASLFLPFI
jgi:hypothetical protein